MKALTVMEGAKQHPHLPTARDPQPATAIDYLFLNLILKKKMIFKSTVNIFYGF